MAVNGEWVLDNNESITLGKNGETTLYTPEQNKSITTGGHKMDFVDVSSVNVEAGSRNVISVNVGEDIGYGVLGNCG